MTEFARVATTREGAHQIVRDLYAVAQALIADGKRVRLSAAEHEDSLTLKQRGFLHAAVLPQIAEQVRVEGERYVAAVWKEHLRGLFLPDRWVMEKRPRFDKKIGRMVNPRKATPHRVRRSTEELGVKGYSEFIDKCIAHATVEWGVSFVFIEREREEVRYRPKATTKEKKAC